MGYSHYWSHLPEHDQFRARWPRMVLDTKTILTHVQTAHSIRLRGLTGHGLPLLTEGAIGFNGDAAENMDYESFWLHHAPPNRTTEPHAAARYHSTGFVWTFCKTARLPYDLAVCVVLLRCHLLAPEVFVIGSDGGWDNEWITARAVYAELFGDPGDTNPLTDVTCGPPATRTPTTGP